MECTVPVEMRLVTNHADVGSLERTIRRAARRLVTLAGEVELGRRRFRCAACGPERLPLDEGLGLEPRTQHTLGVRERALWLVTERNDAKTIETAAGMLTESPL